MIVNVILQNVDLREKEDQDHGHTNGDGHSGNGRIDDLVLPGHVREQDEVSS
jgi:hypothetical protein